MADPYQKKRTPCHAPTRAGCQGHVIASTSAHTCRPVTPTCNALRSPPSPLCDMHAAVRGPRPDQKQHEHPLEELGGLRCGNLGLVPYRVSSHHRFSGVADMAALYMHDCSRLGLQSTGRMPPSPFRVPCARGFLTPRNPTPGRCPFGPGTSSTIVSPPPSHNLLQRRTLQLNTEGLAGQ